MNGGAADESAEDSSEDGEDGSSDDEAGRLVSQVGPPSDGVR
jgi:hypothetical protein